jgi:3-oxoadipate enol-lactonase
VKLYHRFDGPSDAPVLVLSSSLGTTLELWDVNVGALAERFRVLRYDHRGHGRSPLQRGSYTVDELASDVLELLDEHDLERVAFCGLSLGGAVGLWLGAFAAERIDRLVIACSSAQFGPPENWLERAGTVRSDGVSAISDSVIRRWFTADLARREPDLVHRFRGMLEATPSEGYAGYCEAIAAWDFRRNLGEVRVPTLVIAGSDDPSTPPEHGRLIAEGVPDARLEIVEDAAHLVNVAQPAEFSRLVLHHLGAEPEGAAA